MHANNDLLAQALQQERDAEVKLEQAIESDILAKKELEQMIENKSILKQEFHDLEKIIHDHTFAMMKEEAAKKNRKPLKRFSVVMFCRYQKGNGENYGNYNGTWKEEWRADIEAIAGVDGGRVLRSHKKDGVTQKISHGYGTRSNKRQKKSETGICPLAITCV